MNIWAQLHNKKLAYKLNAGLERRKKHLRRWFWHLSDDFKLGLWILAVLALGPAWYILDKTLELFR